MSYTADYEDTQGAPAMVCTDCGTDGGECDCRACPQCYMHPPTLESDSCAMCEDSGRIERAGLAKWKQGQRDGLAVWADVDVVVDACGGVDLMPLTERESFAHRCLRDLAFRPDSRASLIFVQQYIEGKTNMGCPIDDAKSALATLKARGMAKLTARGFWIVAVPEVAS